MASKKLTSYILLRTQFNKIIVFLFHHDSQEKANPPEDKVSAGCLLLLLKNLEETEVLKILSSVLK